MAERERLDLIRQYTLAGRWKVEHDHGVRRMRERGASFRDVRHGLLVATTCALQETAAGDSAPGTSMATS